MTGRTTGIRRLMAVVAGSAALIGPVAARAQEPGSAPVLPDTVAVAVVDFYNRPTTARLSGDGRIPAGAQVDGDLAVLDGTLDLGGRVRGDLMVINGDLHLHRGAVVDGSVTVVGGRVSGADSASVAGPVTSYVAVLRYRAEGTGIAYAGERRPELAAGHEFGFGRTDFVLAVQHGYNRVEGLPISAGPRVRLGHTNPTTLSARLIYRTAAGPKLEPGRLGYVASAEQSIGGHYMFSVNVTGYSEIVPIETNGLSNRENSLATFFLHRDYRDQYEREGLAVAFNISPLRASTLSLLFRAEQDQGVRPASPWALFDNNRDWRPEPVVARGPLRSLALRYSLDTRNEVESPSSGWYIRAEIEAGLSNALTLPIAMDSAGLPVVRATPANGLFRVGTLDLRRYARLSSNSRLSTRIVARGSLDGRPLPPQLQHVLGGEGTLPAYPLMHFDCGARAHSALLQGDTVYPYYGCDRSVLVQMEYDNAIDLGNSLQHIFGATVDLSHAAAWAVFFDAGRAWTRASSREGRGRGQSYFAADAGIGLRLGRLGVYWAVPLSGSGRGPNFFLRIDPRF